MRIHILAPLPDGGSRSLDPLGRFFRERGAFAESAEGADAVVFSGLEDGDAFGSVARLWLLRRRLPSARVIHRLNGPVFSARGKDFEQDAIDFRISRRIADGTIFPTEWGRRECKALGMDLEAGHPTAVIPDPVDPEVYYPPREPQEGRAGRVRGIIVTRSERLRGGFPLYQRLDRRLDTRRFLVTLVGPSPVAFGKIQQRRMIDGDSELAALLRQNDFFLTASYGDARPPGLLEAVYCGLPAIGRADGATPEIVGAGGELFEDVDGLFAAIERVAGSLDAYRARIRPPSIEEIGERYLAFAAELRRRPPLPTPPWSQVAGLLADATWLRYGRPLDRALLARLPDGVVQRVRRHLPPRGPVSAAEGPDRGPVGRGNLVEEDRERINVQLMLRSVGAFLDEMKREEYAGAYRYSLSGDLLPSSAHWGLGNSVFAARTRYMVGAWPAGERERIAAYVSSFQREDGAIADPWVRRRARLSRWLGAVRRLDAAHSSPAPTERAETRQAFAALRCVGERPSRPFLAVPHDPTAFPGYVHRLDWRRPWASASHVSHLVFFLRYHARLFGMHADQVEALIDQVIAEVDSGYRRADGAWYLAGADIPSHERVNGAMKMLTALEAADRLLETGSERLIDLCLGAVNSGHACNHFNVIFVLRHCCQVTSHRRREVQGYVLRRLRLFRQHYWPEHGGFSFYAGHANEHYYGARVSAGLAEPDIHGTMLLTWAIVMVADLLGWREALGLHLPYV